MKTLFFPSCACLLIILLGCGTESLSLSSGSELASRALYAYITPPPSPYPTYSSPPGTCSIPGSFGCNCEVTYSLSYMNPFYD